MACGASWARGSVATLERNVLVSLARLHFGAAKLYLINLCVIFKLPLEGY